VRVLARRPEKTGRARAIGCQEIIGDQGDLHALEEAAKGCDLVYHCAHAFGLGMADALRINVGGTRNVLEAARSGGASRFIYISSVAVYGITPADHTDESRRLRPTGDPYADSKIDAEREVVRYSRSHGLPCVILRPAIVYGPRSKVWSLGICLALKARHPLVVGSGDGICNSLYVDNLIDAMLLAGWIDRAVGESFILTDGSPFTWREFIGYYARMMGIESPPGCPESLAYPVAYLFQPLFLLERSLRKTPVREPARTLVRGGRFAVNALRELGLRRCAFTPRDIRFFTHRAAFDIRKAREILGYEPKVGLGEGMARTEAWLREEGYLGPSEA